MTEPASCRCGHRETAHYSIHKHECLYCLCPEYRPIETTETQTLRGVAQ